MTQKIHPQGRERVVIERVRPEVDGGRFAAKAAVGDLVEISAEIFCDGHDRVGASLLHRRAGDSEWTEVPMTLLAGDRHGATIPATALGVIEFTIEAWVDRYESWRHGTLRKAAAGQEIGVELHA